MREALQQSPDNNPLRLILAINLLTLNRLEEAEKEFSILLKRTQDDRAKMGLARVYFKKGSYSACNVILEEVIEKGSQQKEVFVLHTKALLKEEYITKAIEAYKQVLSIAPNFSDEELDAELRQKSEADIPELDKKSTWREFRQVQKEGGREASRKVFIYNLIGLWTRRLLTSRKNKVGENHSFDYPNYFYLFYVLSRIELQTIHRAELFILNYVKIFTKPHWIQGLSN